jgi:hypothetical protein
MSLGSRVRRNFTLRLLLSVLANVRAANQFGCITSRTLSGERPLVTSFVRLILAWRGVPIMVGPRPVVCTDVGRGGQSSGSIGR